MRIERPLLWVGLAVFACGGEVAPDSERSAQNAGDASDSARGQGGGLPIAALPPCEKGYERSSDQPCPWFADRLCYATKEAACACVCPRERSICISGWPSDTHPVNVFCS